jgi:hypothetical protein
MKSSDVLLFVVVLGFGGVIVYLLMKQQTSVPTVVNNQAAQNCGASYLGVGASVPCSLLANGVKTAVGEVAKLAQPVVNQVKSATAGVSTWEYVVAPVAITHVTVNEIKKIPGLGWL